MYFIRYPLFVILLSLLAFCSSSYSQYKQEEIRAYTYSNGREEIKGEIAPLYFDLQTFKPIHLSFSYAQNFIRAKHLKSIEIKLFKQNRNTELFTEELVVSGKTNLTVEYWDGKDSIEISKESFQGDFHSLIGPSMNDYAYKDSSVIRFNLEGHFGRGTHPDKISQQIIIRWDDKTEDVYTNILTKKEYTKSCISGRPFG